MQGHWIIEMAEMLGTASAKSVEEIKVFLFKQSDTYKIPYDRFAKDIPRQCVFVGTTTKQRFLPLDRTGNRRFYPIMTGVTQAEVHVLTDINATAEYMRQLWAEALTVYKTGHWSFVLEPELEHRLDIYRMNFMAKDTSTGMLQQWPDQYKGDYICTKMLCYKSYRQCGEPNRKTIGEINDFMNNTVEGWKSGPQRSWVRIKVDRPDADKWVELTGTPEQIGIPSEWMEPP